MVTLMTKLFSLSVLCCFLLTSNTFGQAVGLDAPAFVLGPYEYEVRRDDTEAKRTPLAEAIADAMRPVTHTIEVMKID